MSRSRSARGRTQSTLRRHLVGTYWAVNLGNDAYTMNSGAAVARSTSAAHVVDSPLASRFVRSSRRRQSARVTFCPRLTSAVGSRHVGGSRRRLARRLSGGVRAGRRPQVDWRRRRRPGPAGRTRVSASIRPSPSNDISQIGQPEDSMTQQRGAPNRRRALRLRVAGAAVSGSDSAGTGSGRHSASAAGQRERR